MNQRHNAISSKKKKRENNKENKQKKEEDLPTENFTYEAVPSKNNDMLDSLIQGVKINDQEFEK